MKRVESVKIILVLALALMLAGFTSTAMAYTAEYTLDDMGGDCSLIGLWDDATKTCTLSGDLNGAMATSALVIINGSGIVLEGNGHALLAGSSQIPVVLLDATGCTIRNLHLETGHAPAVVLERSSSNTIMELTYNHQARTNTLHLSDSDANTFQGIRPSVPMGEGSVYLRLSDYNILDDIVINVPIVYEMLFEYSSNNTLRNSTITSPTGYPTSLFLRGMSVDNEIYLNTFLGGGIVFDSSAHGGNIVYNNAFYYGFTILDLGPGQNTYYKDLPIGGNYYDYYDTPDEGCEDTNNDNFCEQPLIIDAFSSDQYPWVVPTFITDDADFDGVSAFLDCDDNDPNINPWASEISNNGIDENCNGMWDDTDADQDGYDYTVDCDDENRFIYPGAAEIKHDGLDQDCNGYDLTIDIISATYKAGPDKLTVKAISSYGAAAALVIDGYSEPMTWNNKKSRWEVTVQPAGGNPGTVTVTGPEGSESAPVN